MLKEEDHDTTMEQVLEFGLASFQRLVPKIELGEVKISKGNP